MREAKEAIDLVKIIHIAPYLNYILLGSTAVAGIAYYLIKMQYNFLPYIAFQSPIDARSAKDMGAMMARKKYIKYILFNVSALLFFVPISVGGYFLYNYLVTNKILHTLASFSAVAGAMLILSMPVVAFYGLLNVVFYNRSSIPFQSQINHALDKLLNELKALEENNFKDDSKDKKE